MSTEDMSLVSPQNGINSQLLFQDDPLRFNCTGPPPQQQQQQQQQRRVGDPKTRELTGFIDDNKLFSSTATSTAGSDRYFPSHNHHHNQDFPRSIYQREPQGTSGDDTDGEDDEDDEEDDDEDVDDVDGGDGDGDHENGVDVLVAAIDCNSKSTNCNNNNCTGTINNANNSVNLDKIGNGNAKPKHLSSSFGISGEVMKDGISGGGGGMGQTGNNAVTIAEADGEMYYSQYLQGTEGSGGGSGKDMSVENGCGFSGRKEVSSFLSESGESLRAILSDPVTGALMDDAMILPCGHSFGGGGMQQVIRMKVCYSCSQSISDDSIAPNLSLRAAVQAFRREEELQFYRSSKRRRERFDQEKGGYGDSAVMDPPRGRGVQFPFAVTDRVIIKGNKRTPQRFVGREAVVTTQCLNGWLVTFLLFLLSIFAYCKVWYIAQADSIVIYRYVVKTLDNAESVKLQYRSLAKVSDDPSSKTTSTKVMERKCGQKVTEHKDISRCLQAK
ncbi:unnamed protein product, partial [Dovyalis caffra]